MRKISVIIPAYNSEQYIEKCVESVLHQTYKEIEIIIVDDGSTDRTVDIVDNYSNCYSNIKVVHIENGGLSHARKVGTELATGDYIAHIDSDDWLECDMYEHMVSTLIQHHVDAVCTGIYLHKGEMVSVLDNGVNDGKYYREEIPNLLFDTIHSKPIVGWGYHSFLFERKLITDCVNLVPNDVEQCEDIVGVWGFLVNCKSIYVMNSPKYHYVVRLDSSCHGTKPNYLISASKAYLELEAIFMKQPDCDVLLPLLKKTFYYIFGNHTVLSKLPQRFYLFPYEQVKNESRVIIFGAGAVGYSYVRQLLVNKYANVELWVDNNYKSIKYSILPVSDPRNISTCEFDHIVIASIRKDDINSINKYLVEDINVDEAKIICLEPYGITRFVDF